MTSQDLTLSAITADCFLSVQMTSLVQSVIESSTDKSKLRVENFLQLIDLLQQRSEQLFSKARILKSDTLRISTTSD